MTKSPSLVLLLSLAACASPLAPTRRPPPRLGYDARAPVPGDVMVTFADRGPRPRHARVLPMRYPMPHAWRYRMTE